MSDVEQENLHENLVQALMAYGRMSREVAIDFLDDQAREIQSYSDL